MKAQQCPQRASHSAAHRIKVKMILTLCTACAAPLPEDDAVSVQRAPLDIAVTAASATTGAAVATGKICAAIASGGGAEPYHADKKYEEVVADAVEECAEDTKGQTCYICLEGRLGGRPRARVCVPRGVRFRACLVLGAAGQDFGRGGRGEGFGRTFMRWRWDTCRLCEQDYHGVVRCALGWACWKTYVGAAGGGQGSGLCDEPAWERFIRCKHDEDALPVQEATWL